MGLFDRFKKNKQETDKKVDNISKDYEIKYGMSQDGRLQIDFYDRNIKVGQFYDTTRLIVGDKIVVLANQRVQNCIVSWYRQDDTIFSDPQYENESIDARSYKGVLAQIDPVLLQSDEKYCSNVMRYLLNKKRVNQYLENGLQESPEHPCGKYIGGMRKTENGYSKFFNIDAGIASHNSRLMVERRRENREKMEQKKRMEIDRKKAEIQRLQSEIDDMYR